MKKRATRLGDILAGLGRIGPADQERALHYQRENGGYFGQALVALGLIAPDEVNFALADQYDLPFVHLRPEHIDPAAARTVPADWARERRVLPVLRDGDTVTVLFAEPPRPGEIEAVLRLTGAVQAEPAIATPETIAELIEAVHGVDPQCRVGLADWFRAGLGAGAASLGVSVRGERVVGWYRGETGGPVRHCLEDGWMAELRQLVSPFPEECDERVRTWQAVLAVGDGALFVDCGVLGGGGSAEYVFRPAASVPTPPSAAEADPELLHAVERFGGRAFTIGVVVPPEGADVGAVEQQLPGLPEALLGRAVRSLHISDRPVFLPPGALALRPGGALADVLGSLGLFSLDAVTLDLLRFESADVELASSIANLAVFRVPPTAADRPRFDLDVFLGAGDPVRWHLHS